MQRVTFVPGAVASPAAITIPVPVPDIDLVLAAIITRLPAGMTIPNHLAADVQAATPINNHADHLHDMLLEVVADAAGDRVNSALGPPVTFGRPAAGATIVGVQATRGVQNQTIPPHGFGAGAPVAHGASVGASPSVAAVATRLTTRTISLSVNTVLGDLLTLDYIEVGARVPVS